MQKLNVSIINQVKRMEMQQLEKELQQFVEANRGESMCICPFCHYLTKRGKGTAKVFEDSFKCFACGVWRKI